MKKLILVPFLLLFLVVQAQQVALKKLPPVNMLIERQSLINKITALGLNLGTSESHGTKAVPVVCDQYAIEYPKFLEVQLIKKYKSNIKEYFEAIDGFGESKPKLYFKANEKELEIPFDFAINNNMLTFVQLGVFSDFAINTYNSDADKRASIVAKGTLLPALFNFKPLLKVADIKYYCLVVGFLAKDFTSDSDVLNKDGETIAIVIARSVLIKYINAEITDEDVFKMAYFYSENKNSGGNLKKILLK